MSGEWFGDIRDDGPLHVLWTKAHDHPDYVKSEWIALEKLLERRDDARSIDFSARKDEIEGAVVRAVVTKLRKRANEIGSSKYNWHAFVLREEADAIERGEWLRKERTG